MITLSPEFVKKVGLSLLIGLVLGAILSEMSFVFLKETARAPKDILLTIPSGTAEQVARGEQPPSIPLDMAFVVGDTLVVKNDDNADHKLGPLWIPAHSSARMSLGDEQNMLVECSFQPGNYFGLDVRPSLTLGTRIYGMTYAGLPLGILIALYSLIIPKKKNEDPV